MKGVAACRILSRRGHGNCGWRDGGPGGRRMAEFSGRRAALHRSRPRRRQPAARTFSIDQNRPASAPGMGLGSTAGHRPGYSRGHHQMKPRASIYPARTQAGYLLIECLVYMSVLVVVLGLGLGAFYVCWDYSKALHYATDDITAALHAGERWRADIRSATERSASRPRRKANGCEFPTEPTIIYNFKPAKSAAKSLRQVFRNCCCPRSRIANGDGNPRTGGRLALGSGIDTAPQGNSSAFIVHVRSGGQTNAMKISRSIAFPASPSKRFGRADF